MFLRFALAVAIGLVVDSAAHAQVELVGVVRVPGTATDLSGLPGEVGQGTPHNLFAAISALEHLGNGRYLAVADRGPLDGASQFQCRFHEIELSFVPGQKPDREFRVLSTSLLTTPAGQPLVGALEAFDAQSPERTLRLDPEGLRVGPNGTVFISDEYGPGLFEFDRTGRRLRTLPTPQAFRVGQPAADPKMEDRLNRTGRAANAGWEGLAITPSGQRLVVATQKSLLQDRVEQGGKRVPGRNTRLVEFDLETGATRQLVYQLDEPEHVISEILAVSETGFVVIERDSRPGSEARVKGIQRFSLEGATDVTKHLSLAGDQFPAGVVPVQKSPLLDLLDPRFGFAGPDSPEKWESLAWGPELADGRRQLIVVVDNDYVLTAPTIFAAFAIDPAALPARGQ